MPSLHVLNIHSENDSGLDCSAAELTHQLEKLGATQTVMAFSPFRRGLVRPKSRSTPLEHFRYVCIPGALGLATAGAFLFARVIGKIRELHASRTIDLLHAYGTLPCGHAAMLISRELKLPYVVSIDSFDKSLMQRAGGRTTEMDSPYYAKDL